jgi:hypothetical protein
MRSPGTGTTAGGQRIDSTAIWNADRTKYAPGRETGHLFPRAAPTLFATGSCGAAAHSLKLCVFKRSLVSRQGEVGCNGLDCDKDVADIDKDVAVQVNQFMIFLAVPTIWDGGSMETGKLKGVELVRRQIVLGILLILWVVSFLGAVFSLSGFLPTNGLLLAILF